MVSTTPTPTQMSSKPYADKLIAVSGAASGIGLATTRLLAQLGARLSLADINGDAVQQLAKELASEGTETFWMQFDVSQAQKVDLWIQETCKAFGQKLDGAVNLAGICGRLDPVRDHDPANYEAVFGVNVAGTFNCMSAQLRNMNNADPAKGTKGGSIVNAASVTGIVGKPNTSIYCASKAAVIAMTKAAAREQTASGIRINAVAPGFVQTPLMEAVDRDLGFQLPNESVFDRRARPEEIANVIQFLLSDASSYVTGCVYQVDGGMIC